LGPEFIVISASSTKISGATLEARLEVVARRIATQL
jgi:hypothetical protein